MKLIKHITISTLLLLPLSAVYAQLETEINTESKVVLSEDDIVSLAKTLRKHKQQRMVNANTDFHVNKSELKIATKENSIEADFLRSQITQLENQLKNLNAQKGNRVASQMQSSGSLDNRELQNLKYELSQLKFAVQQLSNKPNTDVVIAGLPQSQNSGTAYQPKEIIVREQIPVTTSGDKTIQQKLDSLYYAMSNIKQVDNPNYQGDFDALQKRMDALKSELNTKNNEPTNYDILVSKYKNYNRDIYFASNSKTLNIESSQIVDELFLILNENDNLDIVVKGFASNKGNALYNENLSMQRTEAVKKALMIRGVHPTRVLTQYHGIDYNATDAEKARRVEMSILVRK